MVFLYLYVYFHMAIVFIELSHFNYYSVQTKHLFYNTFLKTI